MKDKGPFRDPLSASRSAKPRGAPRSMGDRAPAGPPRGVRGPGAGDCPAIPDLYHCGIPKPVHGWMGPKHVLPG